MAGSRAGRTAAVIALFTILAGGRQAAAGAQPQARHSSGVGVHATGLVIRASPSALGETYTEGYLTQPAITGAMASPAGGFVLATTVMLEGLTIARGELSTGSFGEGYVDRRHPHTYLHELTATVGQSAGPVQLSLTAGKGYVAFGTDDPMSRPFSRFPVNHHLAQLLERAIVLAGVRMDHAMLEATAFNGDEPSRPAASPRLDRFGDSWAARATVIPFAGAEIQASHARVASPEYPAGGSLDHRKYSASMRLASGAEGSTAYALAEWARTDAYDRRVFAYRVTSLLAEGAVRMSDYEVGARVESSLRPDEDRLLDPFRTEYPHPESRVAGLTRWTSATARVARRVSVGRRFDLMPFVEATRLQAHATVKPALFDPDTFYGTGSIWELSAGMRMVWGMRHTRMGRYGVAHADAARSHVHPQE